MTLPFAVALFASLLSLAPVQSPDARAEAERLARTGAHARALDAFERIVAANPDDIESRVWIGRLHLWMGHPQLALGVFDAILSANPENVEALVGYGIARINTGNLNAAERPLRRAQELAPSSAEALAALGRLYRLKGHLALSLAYYDRALQQSPADRDIRDARDALRIQRAHRVEAGYQFEHFDVDVPDTHAGTLEVNVRASDSIRVFARGQAQRKFDRDEARGGGGVEWMPNSRFRLLGSALVAEGNALVLPRADVTGEADVTQGRATWLFTGRFLHFASTDVGIGSIGLAWSANDQTVLTFRYYRSLAAFAGVDDLAANNSGSAQVARRVARPLWLYAGYARGYESFETLTAERLTQRGAHIGSAGAAWSPVPMFTLSPAFVFERRDDGTRVGTGLLTLVRRF